jgi:hypothetical protein
MEFRFLEQQNQNQLLLKLQEQISKFQRIKASWILYMMKPQRQKRNY